MLIRSPDGRCSVTLPSASGVSRFRNRMFANVPRIITSWCPRRAPYELKSRGSTPRSISHSPAGEVRAIEPARLMWPGVAVAIRNRRGPPAIVTVKDRGVVAREDVAADRRVHHLGDLRRRRPQLV